MRGGQILQSPVASRARDRPGVTEAAVCVGSAGAEGFDGFGGKRVIVDRLPPPFRPFLTTPATRLIAIVAVVPAGAVDVVLRRLGPRAIFDGAPGLRGSQRARVPAYGYVNSHGVSPLRFDSPYLPQAILACHLARLGRMQASL